MNCVRLLLTLCCLIATFAHADFIVYQGVGEFGEVRFGQFQSSNNDRTIRIALATNPTSNQTHTAHCQHLSANLATLQSGGIIHEIDSQGNKRELTAQEIASAIAQIRHSIASQCTTAT